MAKFWSANPSQLTTAQWALLVAVIVGVLYIVPRTLSATEQQLTK